MPLVPINGVEKLRVLADGCSYSPNYSKPLDEYIGSLDGIANEVAKPGAPEFFL